MSVLEEIKHDAVGLAIIKEWLGDGGKPVDRHLAEHRATICLCCPFNVKTALSAFKQPVADAIKSHLEVKDKSGVSTEYDADLFTCRLCSCQINLKIWTPFEHLRAHTTDNELKKLPVFCWLRKESHA